jgi:hypothetical protein
MSTKYFIWIVHVPMYLWEFSCNFGNFLSIFRASEHFLDFSEIVFALKSISETINLYFCLGRARIRQPDPVHLSPSEPSN